LLIFLFQLVHKFSKSPEFQKIELAKSKNSSVRLAEEDELN